MRLGLLAKKIGMSRYYDSVGTNHAVTILKVDDSKIVDLKTPKKNGYSAVKLSFGSSPKTVNKPSKGFLKKQSIPPFKLSKEFRVSNTEEYKIGDSIDVKNFVEGQFIDITSNSKGKGFAGGMKRHNFSGNRATHGVSISHRSHGSTGQCQDPGKVFKGKKMAGRLGNVRVTIQNLKVLKVDFENNLLLVKGAVPGHKGSLVKIFDSIKKNQNININDSNADSNQKKPADKLDKESSQKKPTASEISKTDDDKATSENQNNEIKSSDNSVSDSKNVDSTDKESVAENKENKTSENKKE